jgi:hypothetical protein
VSARQRVPPRELVRRLGGRYSVALGIDVASNRGGEVFKWFLASILFGARISGALAERTYRAFERARVLSPRAILDAGWAGLVQILDRGGYVRYDEKTATKLLMICEALLDRDAGDLRAIERKASDPRDLEARIRRLGKGIGEVTANIFLRELRGIWPKAEPLPCRLTASAARDLRFVPGGMKDPERILERLKMAWAEDGGLARDFADFGGRARAPRDFPSARARGLGNVTDRRMARFKRKVTASRVWVYSPAQRLVPPDLRHARP